VDQAVRMLTDETRAIYQRDPGDEDESSADSDNS
jgi:hypothetical protein